MILIIILSQFHQINSLNILLRYSRIQLGFLTEMWSELMFHYFICIFTYIDSNINLKYILWNVYQKLSGVMLPCKEFKTIIITPISQYQTVHFSGNRIIPSQNNCNQNWNRDEKPCFSFSLYRIHWTNGLHTFNLTYIYF